MLRDSLARLRPCEEEASPSVEGFRLRDAVVGDDLVLVRRKPRCWELFRVRGGRGRRLGTFATVQEAWTAVDRLDAAADSATEPDEFRRAA